MRARQPFAAFLLLAACAGDSDPEAGTARLDFRELMRIDAEASNLVRPGYVMRGPRGLVLVTQPATWQYYLRKGSADRMRPESGRYDRLINIWKRLPVWVTEFSWPATRGLVDPTEWNRVWGRPLSNSQQARLLGRTIRLFAAS